MSGKLFAVTAYDQNGNVVEWFVETAHNYLMLINNISSLFLIRRVPMDMI
jgi:hypothetical protein